MWDAIVIGSGMGGMTAAGLLAGVGKQKVLVLEKHSEPGGLTHVFRRDGASWDVGLHYVGEVEPGSQARALFDYLSGGELRWNRMPDAFERFVYPGLDFRASSDPGRYVQALIGRFPEEARAIRRYFRDVRAVQRWCMLGFARSFVPRPVSALLRLLQRLTARRALQTTQAYLESHFQSPQLRALLASQWGDYGLPPARSAFAIHAQIVAHYLQGAWFPEGGSARIARTFERGIERQGGLIRVCQEVASIIVRDGRAVGVQVTDRRGAVAREVAHYAPVVISAVGAPITFTQLLPTQGEIGAKTLALRQLMDRLQGGLSAVTLYVRLKAAPSTLGVQGENVWVNSDLDHDRIAAHSQALLRGEASHVYVSFPSAKSGEQRFHTAEIIAFVEEQAFAPWRAQPKGNRGADYAALKKRVGDAMLQLAETAIPGLSALVDYAELATPLTVEHYTSHPRGHFYGLPATPARYDSPLLQARTPIAGLVLSGSDAGCLGIVGALMAGVGAASQVLGASGFLRIQAAIRSAPQPAAAHSLPTDKRRAVLLAKTRLAPAIWQLDFELEAPLQDFAPGQFARLRVAEFEWRDYSIASAAGAHVRLLISTRTGGQGSQFVLAVAPGARTEIELALGRYGLQRNAHRLVFIATGTGLAPFLSMFAQLGQEAALERAELYFGCRNAAEDISVHFQPLPARVVRCLSQETPEPGPGAFKGRVSAAMESLSFTPETTDFYICGSAAMVADCRHVLERRGALHIHTESY